jgi:pimeloyl-ACP methyl ester carboxylesterase
MIRSLQNKLLTPLTAGFDRAAARVLFGRSERSRGRSTSESLGPTERRARLAIIERFYCTERYLEDPDAFFAKVDPDDLREERTRDYGADGEIRELRWHSALLPLTDDPDVVRRLEARAVVNHAAVARLYAHRDRARPTIVLVHGYMGGAFALEERAFPVRAFFDAGLDVVLAVLPHHGPRGVRGRRPLLPASDPRITIESFRHAIVDLRTLVTVLRARGAPAVGAMGMSLGGYSSALLATVEPIDFVVPMIPLASIADFARDSDRLVGTATQRREQHEAIEAAHRVVSPLARASLVDPARALVIAGKGDRITPAAHAKRLAEHLDAPLHEFVGGHLLQLGRGAAFREVRRMLTREGILPERT